MIRRPHRKKSDKFGERLKPYSRILRRGSVGELDARSPEGKFLRGIEAQMVEHLGGHVSFAQQLLISRLATITLRLALMETKLDSKTVTDLDRRIYNALGNQQRLLIRELGLERVTGAEGTALPNPDASSGRGIADLVASR